MRRLLLIVAYVVLLVLDVMFLPFALTLILVGALLGGLGFGVGSVLYVTILGFALGAGLLWLTRSVHRALRQTGPSDNQAVRLTR
jgi:hypothetical protein